MSEESDDPDNPNMLIVHSIPWRSERFNSHKSVISIFKLFFYSIGLNDFLGQLDKRYEQKRKDGITMAKKFRKMGLCSILRCTITHKVDTVYPYMEVTHQRDSTTVRTWSLTLLCSASRCSWAPDNYYNYCDYIFRTIVLV